MRVRNRSIVWSVFAASLALLAAACGSGEEADATGRGVGSAATASSTTQDPSTTVTEPPVSTSSPVTTTGEAASPSSAPVVETPDPVLIPVLFDQTSLPEVRPDPTSGAGTIETKGAIDVYTFDVADGQAFLIEQLGDCDFDGDDALSLDVDGPGINSGVVFIEDNCRTAHRFESDATGTIELTVEDVRAEVTGTYSFRVIDVTDPDPIDLLPGDEVGPNAPVQGAGWIEGRGHQDLYTYEVGNDGAFLIEQLGGCDLDGDDALAADVDGPGINSTAIFLDGDCLSGKRFDADFSGPVRITVRDAGNDAFGTYRFRITDVSDPDPVELLDGTEIRPDSPSGAGNLEARGMRDVYLYNAAEGQAFVIEQLGDCRLVGDDFISMKLRGAGINSTAIISDGECRSTDRFEPDETEVIRIVVESAGNDAWGSYTFILRELP